MVLVAEDRGAARGLVGADALEDAGAVVERVRQYVDLCVLPGDEFAVHPDEVRLVHVSSSRTARVASAVVAVPPRSRGPQTSLQGPIHGRFYPRRVVRPGESVPEQHRRREDHRERVGDPLAGDVGRRAVDGLEDAGSVCARAGARQQPDRAGEHRRLVAEDVAEHVLGEDHVEVARGGDELHRGVVDEQVLELDVRELLAVDAHDDLAPQPAGLEHVGLVDAGDPRACGLERGARDPLDLVRGVRADVGARCRRCGAFSPK